MAFRRYANARVTHPSITSDGWARAVAKAQPHTSRVAGSKDLVSQATEILGTKFDPKEYLLSHATIVCSVDTDPVPNVKLGSVTEDGVKINRKYNNYYIKPESSKFVNNNGDAWTRPVLLKSYRTFIGAQNYLEHVQVEELSKGRIIDAVARDVGESLYVDILVATHRKHTELIADILSGKMNGMSMGCFVPGTLVTLADGRRVPIEHVLPGQRVLTHTGAVQEVLNKQIRYGQWNTRRVLADGVVEIVATDNHPFFVFREGGLVEVRADELVVGDLLHRPGLSPAPVMSVTPDTYTGAVHDMEVEGDHSYVVEGVAVHNCNTTFTTCTKCGNVAVDETELCNCIRYSKLNKFFTPDGKQRVIAELCGHVDEGSTAGVTFIEASWVANPAFTGAVLRNVIEPVNLTPAATKKAREVLSSPPPEWAAVGTRSMAASTPAVKIAEEFDFGGEEPVDEGMGDEESAATPEGEAKKEKTPLEETEDKLYKEILDRVQKRVKNEIDQKDESAKSVTAPNDTLIKNATAQRVYVAAIKDITRTASSIPSIVARIAALDSGSGVLAPETAYRVAAKVGALHRYGSESKYLAACSEALGRNPTQSEATALMRLGRILNSADRSASVPLVRSKR